MIDTTLPPLTTNRSSSVRTEKTVVTTPPVISGSSVSDRVATLSTSDLSDFHDQSPAVQNLLTRALALTSRNLSYKYGSCDPSNGGMDCSGTVYYLLNEGGVKNVPRDASEMYSWVWKSTGIRAVVSPNPKTFELDPLKPGDLLFWTGTYKVDRDPPVTHVMIYLGTNSQNGHRVMMGASEGRTYEGKSRYGVSVFDFNLPQRRNPILGAALSPEPEGRFVGYGSVPGLDQAKSPISISN